MATHYPNHPKYIPIIKWQQYEHRALENVDSSYKHLVLPCIEIRTTLQHQKLLSNFSDVWGAPALIDYANPEGTLTLGRAAELYEFLSLARTARLPITPVLNPQEVLLLDPALLSLATSFEGIVLRLRVRGLTVSAEDFSCIDSSLVQLTQLNIRPRLLVDLGTSPTTWTDISVAGFASSLVQLKERGFSSIHLASGAFPASLAAVTGAVDFGRRDWLLWQTLNRLAPDLLLGYSDYGVLAPTWTEETLNRRGGKLFIRYTKPNDWLIIRADGKTKADSIAISIIMVGNYGADFKGRDYSYGDKLLADRADPAINIKKKLCGHYHITEGWSHHIAMVIRDQY